MPGLTDNAIDRVSETVRKVERMSPFPPARRSNPSQLPWAEWNGKIVQNGPDEENDFQDHRYWVRPLTWLPANAENSPSNDAIVFELYPEGEDGPHEYDVIRPVTNMGEFLTRGHLLFEGDIVTCRTTTDAFGNPRSWMNVTPRFPFVLVRIDNFLVRQGLPGGLGSQWLYEGVRMEIDVNTRRFNEPPSDSYYYRSFRGAGGTLMNSFEAHNKPRNFNQVQGNGVFEGGADYPSRFNLQPLGGGWLVNTTDRGKPIVRAYPIYLWQTEEDLKVTDPTKMCWIVADPNSNDGVCD